MVFHFVTTCPASNYFLDLVQNLKEQCVRLDTFIHNKEYVCFLFYLFIYVSEEEILLWLEEWADLFT